MRLKDYVISALEGLPWWLREESTFNEGHSGSFPGLGRFPWRWEWQPTPVFLPGEFHGQRSLEGYSPLGCKESDMTEWLTHTHTLTVECPQPFLDFGLAEHLLPQLLYHLSLMHHIPMWLVASPRSLLLNPLFKVRRSWKSECACLWQSIKIITMSYFKAHTDICLTNIIVLPNVTL